MIVSLSFEKLGVFTLRFRAPMNCVARKMWGIHDAVHSYKVRRHFRFSLTSIPNIPKRDLYGCPSRT